MRRAVIDGAPGHARAACSAATTSTQIAAYVAAAHGGDRPMLPPGLDPAAVQAVAMDLDRTILGPSLEFTDALVDGGGAPSSAAGIAPIIATGRMFRSARPYALQLGITAPVICYQGALIADPATGEWLLHRPIDVAARAAR